MSAKFDPYHKWLGILPRDQPPNHYRLLGLEAFEEDLQVIESAADRQLTFLRKYQSGEHAADCHKLLNEVSRARLCLLKTEAKRIYDEQLRTQFARSENAIDFEIPSSPQPLSVNRQKAFPIVPVAGAVGGVIVLLVIAAVLWRPAQPPVVDPSGTSAVTDVKRQPVPTVEIPKASPAINILPLLSSENIVKGRWRIEQDRLESLGEADLNAQVQLPVAVPAEYTIHVTGTRMSEGAPTWTTLGLGLVCGGYDCLFALETTPPHGTVGIQFLDDRGWDNNETTLRRTFTSVGIPFELDVIVRKQNIEARLDGRTIADWSGDFSRLSRPPEWNIAQPNTLYIAAASQYVFSQLTIGPPLARRPEPGSDLKVGETVELLNFVELKSDVWSGKWAREGLSMKSTADPGNARFSVPYEIPDDYELIADIQSESPGKNLYLGLPFQVGFAGIGIGGEDSETNLLIVDDRIWPNEPSVFQRRQLLTQERNQIVATVRKNHLKIRIGETTVFDWRGNARRHTKFPFWSTPGQHVTVGTHNTSHRIRSLKLTRLEPSADVFTKPAIPSDGNLLAIVDPVRDTTHGVWNKSEHGVRSSQALISGLLFPANLPANYEFRLVIERKSPNDTIQISVPVAGRSVMVSIDGWRSTASGIELIDSRRANENSTTIRQTGPALVLDRPAVLLGRVEGRQLRIDLDGKTLWSLEIPENHPVARFAIRPGWMSPEQRLQLHVSTWDTSFELHEVRFRSLEPNSPPFPALDLAALARTTSSPSQPASAPVSAPAATPSQPVIREGALLTGTTPVPEKSALESARKKVRDLHVEDFAKARKDEDKLSLAAKLEKVADTTNHDSAVKFVCLDEARQLASDAGDLTKSFALADQMGLEFQVEPATLKAATLQSVAPRLKGPLPNKELIDKALPVIDQLLEVEKFPEAVELANVAAQAAVKLKDKAVQSDIAEIRKKADELAKEFALVEQARATLRANPGDASARQISGRWLCIRNAAWAEGLKFLQGCDDSRLAELARRDLQGPPDRDAMLQLAQDWLEYAKSRKGHTHADFAERTLFWLAKAEVQANGLTRAKIDALKVEAVTVRDWISPLTGLLEQIAKKVGQKKYIRLEETKTGGGNPYLDLPAEGGVLIGFNGAIGRFYQVTVIRGLQPVYATKLGLKTGDWHGSRDGQLFEVRARPGYAVNGIFSQYGTVYDNMQLSFARITRTGLDADRTYLSPLFGGELGQRGTTVSKSGNQPVIGIYGRADDFLKSIGMIAAK